jgi:hypothetical protein
MAAVPTSAASTSPSALTSINWLEPGINPFEEDIVPLQENSIIAAPQSHVPMALPTSMDTRESEMWQLALPELATLFRTKINTNVGNNSGGTTIRKHAICLIRAFFVLELPTPGLHHAMAMLRTKFSKKQWVEACHTSICWALEKLQAIKVHRVALEAATMDFARCTLATPLLVVMVYALPPSISSKVTAKLTMDEAWLQSMVESDSASPEDVKELSQVQAMLATMRQLAKLRPKILHGRKRRQT